MLMNCPECELQVSDKAITCPHCGFPLKKDIVKRSYTPRKERKRLPNGFGQITKINNRTLRKPYRAMITVGTTPEGKPITKILKPEGYFKTYNDAYAALVEYNRNPYDLDDDITVKELYEKWTAEYFGKLKNDSSKRTIISSWSYCSSIYNMRAKDVRPRHIKGCMDNGVAIVRGVEKTPSAGVKSRIKSLFNLMYDYGIEYDIVDRNPGREFNISQDIVDESEALKRKHIPFKTHEIETLWKNINATPYIDIMLIQIYSGWRPQELGLIKLENVDTINWTFSGGMKTEAGTNRIVPIHSKIRHLVIERYRQAQELGSEYLFNCTDSTTHKGNLKLTYDKYSDRFKKVIELLKLNPEHRPHDGRNTFVTLAKKYNVDEYALKYIVGHKITDITESVYTTREPIFYATEMEKIK